MEVPIPKSISLISFDNMPEAMPFPISTIDPGFAHLGYLAAHALIGDIPIGEDANGCIAGTWQLIDKGSLGPAGA